MSVLGIAQQARRPGRPATSPGSAQLGSLKAEEGSSESWESLSCQHRTLHLRAEAKRTWCWLHVMSVGTLAGSPQLAPISPRAAKEWLTSPTAALFLRCPSYTPPPPRNESGLRSECRNSGV